MIASLFFFLEDKPQKSFQPTLFKESPVLFINRFSVSFGGLGNNVRALS